MSWRDLETPPRKELLGHLEQEPVEGPPSRFKVEERFHRFKMGIGHAQYEVDEATVWDMRQEEWENVMINAQWE